MIARAVWRKGVHVSFLQFVLELLKLIPREVRRRIHVFVLALRAHLNVRERTVHEEVLILGLCSLLSMLMKIEDELLADVQHDIGC